MTNNSPYKIGQAYIIRTVTWTWTGRLTHVGPHELTIEDAAWVADTGPGCRYSQATSLEALGSSAEVEPREGPVILGRNTVVDAAHWTGDLPRERMPA